MATERDPHSREALAREALARDDLAREDLARILGLPASASDEALRDAAERLLGVLRRRRHALLHASAGADQDDGEPGAEGNAVRALSSEIESLERAAARYAGWIPAGRRRRSMRSAERDRWSLVAAMLVVAGALAMMIAYASGLRVVSTDRPPLQAAHAVKAKLILLGELPGAVLRVLDADRAEVFAKLPAVGAVVELTEGRYAIEVSREDCPDTWTRSVYFEAGSVHRFEPRICEGEGRVTVRSNVTDDRLLIDGFDVGATGAEPRTLPVGDHEIRVEKKGYTPFEARIRVGLEDDLQLRAELRRERRGAPEASPSVSRELATPDLAGSALPVPEPFDLGDFRGELRKELAPSNSRDTQTRLLARGAGDALPDGGSTAWHDRVSRELLTRFDRDGSGAIDQLEESEAIGCALWLEIERDFDRGGLGLSMVRYFGFDGSEWHPKALGFARGLRGAAYSKMKECGLQH